MKLIALSFTLSACTKHCNWRMNFVFRVVSLSLCSRKECFISGSLDRTVMLWDQRAEKCQVDAWKWNCAGFLYETAYFKRFLICVRMIGSFTCTRKACYSLRWPRASFYSCIWWLHTNVWRPHVWKGQLFVFQYICGQRKLGAVLRIIHMWCMWRIKNHWFW